MTLACRRRVASLLGSGALLALACGPARILDDGSTGTGSASTDNGGASSSGGSSSGGSSSGGTGGGSSSGGSSSTGTDEPPPPCEPVQLADIAAGIGGFASLGERDGDLAGYSLDAVGDMNGDGSADVVVGAPDSDLNGSRSGRAYVVFGKGTGSNLLLADVANGHGGFVIDGEAEGYWSAESVSGSGDINGDQVPDVIVGARFAYPNGVVDSGRAYVVFGKADTGRVALADVAQGIGGFALDAESAGDFAGRSVSGAGDVNGDGLADLLVGAPRAKPNGVIRAGRAYVVFGKQDTANVALAEVAEGIGGFVIDGEEDHDGAGESASGAGDINGDGLADLVVGAPYADPNGDLSGRAYVVFGKENPEGVALADVAAGIGGFVLNGESERNLAGAAVAGAGDINGDGLADVIVGAFQASPNGTYSGRAYVVLGTASTDTVWLEDVAEGVGGFALDGEAAGDSAGWSVSGLGDINGDGLAEVVVGALWADPTGAYSGRAYVVFGKQDTDRVSLADIAHGIGGFALDGEAATHLAGQSVSEAGDVNDDGTPDLLVGAPAMYAEPGDPHAPGRAYVVFGGDFSCGG